LFKNSLRILNENCGGFAGLIAAYKHSLIGGSVCKEIVMFISEPIRRMLMENLRWMMFSSSKKMRNRIKSFGKSLPV